MLQGKQIGTMLSADSQTGIQITLEPYGDPRYQRITNGSVEPYKGFCMYKDKYCTRQGNMVGGIALCDAKGYPMDNEHYMLSEFTWSGNISYGGGEAIPFL